MHYRLAELLDGADDHPAAIAEYEIVATKFGESQYAAICALRQRVAQFKDKEFVKGAESFTSLLSKFPQHRLGPMRSSGEHYAVGRRAMPKEPLPISTPI